jgi:hypothetical protein
MIRDAGIDHIAPILGRGIAEQVFAQLGKGEADSPRAATAEQKNLDHFGEGT